MPSYFEPPTDNFVSYEDEERTRIFSRIAPGPRGRNIYKLTNGSFVEYQPGDMDTVDTVYYGGHRIEVTADEVTNLTAAGYGNYIT